MMAETRPRRRWYARRSVVVGGLIAGILVISGTAFAYWTVSGSGTATGATASGAQAVTLTGTVAGSGTSAIAPGLSKTVTFTAANPNAYAVKIGQVSTVSIASDDGAGVDCNAAAQLAEFSMASFNAGGQSIPASATVEPVTATGTLVYNNNAALNQDVCKDDVLTITVSVAAAS
jgi:hypothetical protein